MEKISFEVSDFAFIENEDEEFAAVTRTNPTFKWCKFILTDDGPNKNKKRVPLDEFDNLVFSGVNAPIKMAPGQIEDGHDKSIPLGVITALKRENNQIKAIAALWTKERPEDVAFVKKCYDEGKPLNLSWEILYSNLVDEEDGIQALQGTVLRAATLVGLPAYAGRTPILEMASTDSQGDQINSEDDKLDEQLEQLNLKITELTQSLATVQAENEQLKTEKESLAQFKADVEKERLDAERVSAIQIKFSEAGIEKDTEYFTENREKLLAMDEATLDFMVQNLVAFASKIVPAENASHVTLPNVNGNSTSTAPKELGRKLRNSK
jgi:hypothetical protein